MSFQFAAATAAAVLFSVTGIAYLALLYGGPSVLPRWMFASKLFEPNHVQERGKRRIYGIFAALAFIGLSQGSMVIEALRRFRTDDWPALALMGGCELGLAAWSMSLLRRCQAIRSSETPIT